MLAQSTSALFAIPLLGGDEKAQGLAMACDGEGRAAFEVAREILAKFAHANFVGLHLVHLCTQLLMNQAVTQREVRCPNWGC